VIARVPEAPLVAFRKRRIGLEDDGPGVAEADLPHLTDRFYRGESSRTTPGNGLGLSLVSAVAELHGATLDLNVMKPGLRIILAFPIVRDGRRIHGIGGAAVSHRQGVPATFTGQ
jgi:signal transduction histidine kinase